MYETQKLNEYRIQNNYDDYFRGNGIDIGCGSDLLSKSVFKNNNNEFECVNGFDSNQIISIVENLIKCL